MTSHPTKTGILLAAFGSASPAGEQALDRFARRVRDVFPAVPVRWAYTSDRMRSRLAAVGKKTDSVKKALCRMGFERYTHVAVQSLHLIPGFEYECLLEEAEEAGKEGGPGRISVGRPLLQEPEDVALAARALLRHLPPGRRPAQPVVCMAHGSWHSGEARYQALADAVSAKDGNIFIGTMEGGRGVRSLLPRLREAGSPVVWLLPLLSIIGKHAEQDMAGPGPESWRGQLEAAGFTCRPQLTGTVEYQGFARIWLAHLEAAVAELGQ